MKAQTIDNAFWKIVQMWPRSPTRETLEGILGEVYEAGRLDRQGASMSDWEQFFKQHGEWRVMLGFYEMRESVSVEELYKAFKSRMASETANDADSDGGECD